MFRRVPAKVITTFIVEIKKTVRSCVNPPSSQLSRLRSAKHTNVSHRTFCSTRKYFYVIAHGPKVPICCPLTRWGATESTPIPRKFQMKTCTVIPAKYTTVKARAWFQVRRKVVHDCAVMLTLTRCVCTL